MKSIRADALDVFGNDDRLKNEGACIKEEAVRDLFDTRTDGHRGNGATVKDRIIGLSAILDPSVGRTIDGIIIQLADSGIGKGTAADPLHTLGNGHRAKACALTKGLRTDALQSGGKRQVGKAFTAVEGKIADGGDRFGKRDGAKARASGEDTIRQKRQLFGNTVILYFALCILHLLWYGD